MPPALAHGSPALARVPHGAFEWPSGIDRHLVVLRAEPSELKARYGLGFRHDLDGLDYHLVSVVRLPSGRYVKFARYYRSPAPGTGVSVDRNDALDEAWAELQAVLGVDDAATTWQSEFLRGAEGPSAQ